MTERRTAPALLQPFAVPLRGRTLIEASAGTGKTWTIAALYLRLLLESRLQVQDILVLTFTIAATAELRERILRRLLDAREVLSGVATGDELLQAFAHRSADKAADCLWLTAAIENFDLAPIHTIHAFCQRALADHAFESGSAFEAEVIEDETALIESALRDCWRIDMSDAHPLWAQWLGAQKIDPAKWMADVIEIYRRRDVRIDLPPAPPEDFAERYARALADVRNAWTQSDDAFDLIQNSASLNRNFYKKNDVPRWRDAIAACVHAAPFQFAFPDCVERFTPAGLLARLKNGEAPSHPLFDALAQWRNAYEAFNAHYAHWTAAAARRVDEQLRVHKRDRRMQSYDDWLRDLDEALHGTGGEVLAQALRRRYPAALVDEFQDTDPRQYRILATIYADREMPLYFVGDPKQAIYSFRGADVYAYLRAREDVEEQRTLRINRRSSPALVRGINALFDTNPRPFIDGRIDFHPAEAVEPARTLYVAGDEVAAPLQCWFMSRDEDAKPITKGRAGERVAEATAAEIQRLLGASASGEARVRDRPLLGSDIAVLVRGHHQARAVRAALAHRSIASVSYGQDNIYCSEEASEIAQVLRAIAEPAREDLLRAALATLMLGRDARQLAVLRENEAEWSRLRDRYAGYERTARQLGFIHMWRTLSADEAVTERLLALKDGERRLTNLRHLADLLHCAAEAADLDLDGLIRHLEHEATEQKATAESHQLRLESDENLVRVLTVHAVKGLQFSVVFCPFLWFARQPSEKEEVQYFHDDAGQPGLDFGSDRYDAHRERAREEEKAEELRLAYVALTRAEHRCVFFWGAVTQAGDSPLAWLLHGAEALLPSQLAERFKTLSDEELRASILKLAARESDAIALRECSTAPATAAAAGAADAEKQLQARPLRTSPPRSWRVSSFSGLILPQEREAPDYDALAIATTSLEDAPPESPLMALPGGVRFGTFVHKLFEQIDFRAACTDAVDAIVRDTLAEFDFDPAWAGAMRRMLVDTVETPLDDAGLRLSDIAPARRLVEMEFLFPIGDPSASKLREAVLPLRDAGSRLPDAIGNIILAPTQGFIRGFIDLVFEAKGRYYVADYKSNRLGMRYEDYAPRRLIEAMSESWYDLQYLLYTVALHRHLRTCVPGYDYESHFGGVYYLFVRGMAPDRGAGSGVYFARPSAKLIADLDEALRSDERLIP